MGGLTSYLTNFGPECDDEGAVEVHVTCLLIAQGIGTALFFQLKHLS